MIVRKTVFGIILGIACCTSALTGLRAEEKVEDLQASIDKRLATFDPAAVDAARHYFLGTAAMNSFKAAVPQIVKALDTAVEQSNSNLDAASRKEALDAVQSAVTGKIQLIAEISMVHALEVFSKDELVALDQFYSSPMGQSVIMKLPLVMSKLPQTLQLVMPAMLDDVHAQMKAKGKDLK